MSAKYRANRRLRDIDELDVAEVFLRIDTLLTVVLIACGLWTAGAGSYVAITAPAVTKDWPDAAPIIVDQTATMPIDTANRIWWAADDLWRKETVLTLFEIVKPAPGTNGPSVELPKSGAVSRETSTSTKSSSA
jgi:hypothetical protein